MKAQKLKWLNGVFKTNWYFAAAESWSEQCALRNLQCLDNKLFQIQFNRWLF